MYGADSPIRRKGALMLLLIDNYDSFTYNLVHYFGELGADVTVQRNDALDVQAAMALNPSAIVLSPGPCDPDQAGICLPLTVAAAEARIPLLGVCLGHQTIGQAFGGALCAHRRLCMASWERCIMRGRGCLPACRRRLWPRAIIRWWSNVTACPSGLEVTSWLEDGLIMGLRHRDLPIEGVQFHPESIRSQHGHAMLRNFLD